MTCDRAKRAGRAAGRAWALALLFCGAAALAVAPYAVAQDDEAEEAEETEEPEEADEAEEAPDSPEGEAEPEEGEDPSDAADDLEPEAPEETDEDADSPPASVNEEGDDEAKWRERHQQMLDAVKESERRIAEAEAQRAKLGDRYSYGGRTRAEIVGESDSAERSLQRAQRDLDRFYEEARRADVPPGWVREDD